MGLEAVIEIDTSDFRDDNDFADIVGDIAIDVIRDSGEFESIVRDILESEIRDYMHDAVDPDNEHFINAVAKALHNMARSYVGV